MVLYPFHMLLWPLTSQAESEIGSWAPPLSSDLKHGAAAGGQGRGQVLMNCSVSCPGGRAEVNANQVATVMWDYFSQLGNNAKEAVEHLQKSELTQQLK